MAGLRSHVYRGGAYLGAREVLGIAVRSLGLLVTVGLLGPAGYGAYAGALALVVVLAFVAQAGVDTYLNRREEPFDDVLFDRASTFLAVSSVVVAGLGLAASVAAAGVLEQGMSVPVLQILLLTIPLNVLWAPAQARLDKQFRFRAVAALELSGDVVLHVTSVALILAGLGVWGPVAGFVAWQAWLLVGSHVLVGRVPRPRWSAREARAMVAFGLPFGLSQCLRSAEAVVNPLVVGPIAGTAGVGVIALSLRVLETFGFILRAGARLAVLAFSASLADRRRLRRGLEEAVLLQVVGLGALLAAVGVGLEFAVAAVLGDGWRPVAEVFPYLALTYLGMAFFSAQSTYLQVTGRVWRIVAMCALRLALLAGGTAILVPVLGLRGFGVAYALSLVAYLVTHRAVKADTRYRPNVAFPWAAGFGAVLFAGVLPAALIPLTLVPLAVALAADYPRRSVLALATRARAHAV